MMERRADPDAGTLRAFDVSWESVQDGPGVRCVVYLSGCNQRCPWCHSPHSWLPQAALLYFDERCTHCGACVEACPNGVHALDAGAHTLQRERCVSCGRCVRACPTVLDPRRTTGALALPRIERSPEDFFERLRPQLELLRNIGGLTLSGGEPLLQPGAAARLVDLCRSHGFDTAIETSGGVPWAAFTPLLGRVEHWLFGLRPVAHGGGADGAADFPLVRENLGRLVRQGGGEITIRTPVIPGLTQHLAAMGTVAEIMRGYGLGRLELLPSNPHVGHYYRALGMSPPPTCASSSQADSLGRLVAWFADQGIDARIAR